MSIAKALERTATKVIARLGGDVTIRYVTIGAYNTTTGAAAETVSDTNIKGVVQDVTKAEVNDLIQAEDRRLIVAANDLAAAPETKDRVVISSVVYQIISVNTIEQDNTPLTYELILRS